jgi:hypothetical protein
MVALMVAVGSLTGCGPDGTGGRGATGGGSGGSATAGSGGHGSGGAAGGGGSTATGGVGAGGGAGTGSAHDCFPPCIANLRKNCERPGLDGGTCSTTSSMICYSNGVREIDTAVDGGETATFTETDGQTPCYKVVLDSSSGVETYETPDGQTVAVVTAIGAGGYMVTCGGTTTTVNISGQACAMVTEAQCSAAASCP